MYETTNIFILKGMNFSKKTELDWEKECKIFNLELSAHRQKSIEDYKSFQHDFDKTSDWKIDDYNHAYFTKEEIAIIAAKENMGGLDDGGVYKYCAIIEVPCGVSYPELGEIESFHLFKYNGNGFDEIFTGKEYDIAKKYFYIFE